MYLEKKRFFRFTSPTYRIIPDFLLFVNSLIKKNRKSLVYSVQGENIDSKQLHIKKINYILKINILGPFIYLFLTNFSSLNRCKWLTTERKNNT